MSESQWTDELEKNDPGIRVPEKTEKPMGAAQNQSEDHKAVDINPLRANEEPVDEKNISLQQHLEGKTQQTGNSEINEEVKMVHEGAIQSDHENQQHSDERDNPGQKNGQRKELSNKEITDHTANLWKYLPIPKNEPDPAPEYKVSDLIYPGSKVVAARVRGKKHKHEGSNCDDWFETAFFGDVTFAAVSDGAGSKKFSRVGAKESCRAAVGYLINEYPKLLEETAGLREHVQLPLTDEKCISACRRIAVLVQHSVLKAREAVEAAFYSRSLSPAYAELLGRNLALEDLSGTLLVSAIVPVRKETKEHLIVTCQVGDGMTASINSKGAYLSSVKLLGVPDSGEFTGETEFLTSKKIKNVEELQKRTKLFLGPVDTVLMMSDGVADDYYPNETQMRRLYFDLIANEILHQEGEKKSLADLDAEQMSLFKKIPDPISYPWVNDKSVMVPIQYTKNICESMNLSLETLWNHREILELAALEVKRKTDVVSDAEKLKQWLDSYYERGSFDDRTLVMIEL